MVLNDYKSMIGFKDGSVLQGQSYVGINGNQISMRDASKPLIGISDKGDFKVMQPGGEYSFEGSEVLEITPESIPQYEDQLLAVHLSSLKPKDQKLFSEKYAMLSNSMKDTVLMEILRKHPNASNEIRNEVKMQAGGRFEFVPEGMRLVGISVNEPTDYPRKGATQNLNDDYPPKRASVPPPKPKRSVQSEVKQKVQSVEDKPSPSTTQLIENVIQTEKPQSVNYFSALSNKPISTNPLLQQVDASKWKVKTLKSEYPNKNFGRFNNYQILEQRNNIVITADEKGNKWVWDKNDNKITTQTKYAAKLKGKK